MRLLFHSVHKDFISKQKLFNDVRNKEYLTRNTMLQGILPNNKSSVSNQIREGAATVKKKTKKNTLLN